jgi:ABC-type nitrate/sulfonate/bicarbonate transport system permease component
MSTRLLNIYLVVIAFTGWTFLYYYVDPIRLPHPKSVLKVLLNLDFLAGFIFMLIQSAFGFFFGAWLGTTLANLIKEKSWLTETCSRLFRYALWLPFFVYWALPIWPPTEKFLLEPFFWAYVASALTVTMSVCYESLSISSIVAAESLEGRRYILRRAAMHALLISLVSQRWLSSPGWAWFNFEGLGRGPSEAAAGYVASLFIFLVALFVLNQLLEISFDYAAGLNSSIITRSLSSAGWTPVFGSMLFILAGVVLWQLFSMLQLSSIIGSPGAVLQSAFHLLISGADKTSSESTNLWGAIGTSLFEILIGYMAGGAAAAFVLVLVSHYIVCRNWLISVLPMTYISPFFLSFVMIIYWSGYLALWRTGLGVALLIFFPLVQALWGLRDKPRVCRIILATTEALPFAFIAMVFGETVNSVSGLGHFMLVARSYLRLNEAIAAALITFALLVFLSSILRWAGKRVCFPPAFVSE